LYCYAPGAAAASLDAIRGALVRQAVVEGAEAEEVARAAVIRLRMLDDIQDAARLWNAFRPAGVGLYKFNHPVDP
jgi:hypothetical protein